jgi:hypothetical protein
MNPKQEILRQIAFKWMANDHKKNIGILINFN